MTREIRARERRECGGCKGTLPPRLRRQRCPSCLLQVGPCCVSPQGRVCKNCARSSVVASRDVIIGPGFPPPDAGADVPRICAGGCHAFEERGVCKTCRRTVSELARLGLAKPFHCSETRVHVLVGPVCIECGETILKAGA